MVCKANETRVVSSDQLVTRLKDLGVSFVKVEYTARKDRERLELERAGAAVLPVNLVYPPNYPTEPAIKLSSLVSPAEFNRVLDRMEEILDSEKQADPKAQ